jgi:hypothetical protein
MEANCDSKECKEKEVKTQDCSHRNNKMTEPFKHK